MTKPRIAFTAGLWGEGAVVCKTLEDSVGSSVVQEFGLFETWTEANTFANKLNEGLGLQPDEAREITTGALLAFSDRFHAPIQKSSFWYRAPVLARANSLQVQFLFAQVELAWTFCQLVQRSELADRNSVLMQRAAGALDTALTYLPRLRMSKDESELFFRRLELLKNKLPGFSCALSKV